MHEPGQVPRGALRVSVAEMLPRRGKVRTTDERNSTSTRHDRRSIRTRDLVAQGRDAPATYDKIPAGRRLLRGRDRLSARLRAVRRHARVGVLRALRLDQGSGTVDAHTLAPTRTTAVPSTPSPSSGHRSDPTRRPVDRVLIPRKASHARRDVTGAARPLAVSSHGPGVIGRLDRSRGDPRSRREGRGFLRNADSPRRRSEARPPTAHPLRRASRGRSARRHRARA
ncbi:hypothetical protein DFJ64_1772 [Thermasporomyces composti]|uniref:Uncharacterized protein n=1 Tax=Thermasporomyces composti TaxID=696763 RepID=A0A3D9VBG4_THECX|nr:hypothetical protein DFJ64_1772 [Thermasporomyces composti]